MRSFQMRVARGVGSCRCFGNVIVCEGPRPHIRSLLNLERITSCGCRFFLLLEYTVRAIRALFSCVFRELGPADALALQVREDLLELLLLLGVPVTHLDHLRRRRLGDG